MTKREIERIEDISFIKWYLESHNDSTYITNYNTGVVTTVNTRDLLFFIERLLPLYRSNRNHKITGADIAGSFEIKVSTKEHLVKLAQDIWDNPGKYREFDEDEDYYYDFLKYLWIESPDFPEETRLCDIVKTDTETE
jgi:hypothetical protein